jgi:hypothetical protein
VVAPFQVGFVFLESLFEQFRQARHNRRPRDRQILLFSPVGSMMSCSLKVCVRTLALLPWMTGTRLTPCAAGLGGDRVEAGTMWL